MPRTELPGFYVHSFEELSDCFLIYLNKFTFPTIVYAYSDFSDDSNTCCHLSFQCEMISLCDLSLVLFALLYFFFGEMPVEESCVHFIIKLFVF